MANSFSPPVVGLHTSPVRGTGFTRCTSLGSMDITQINPTIQKGGMT
jgi:hypothetical protein